MEAKHRHLQLFIRNCITTFLMLIAATGISFLFVKITNINNNVAISYILCVVLVSMFTSGYIWGILASIAGTFGVNYYFTYPYFAFDFTRNHHPLTFIGMLVISLITSTLTAHIINQTKRSSEREIKAREQHNLLLDINNKLLYSNGFDYIIELTLEYIVAIMNSTVIFYSKSPQLGEKGVIKSCSPNHDKILSSHHEQFIAHWVFEHKTQAGVGTDFCGESSFIYLPLISHNIIWGVIGVYCVDLKPIDDNHMTFLNLMLSQVAMAIERQHLSDEQQLMRIETEKEKMKANLLRAVSHDLRTPLTGMIGASEILMKNKKNLSDEEQNNLIGYIYEDSNWLLHMVENLLSVTRIHEGNSSVNKVPEPLEEVVSVSIMHVKQRYPKAKLLVKVPDEFIMVPMDATLIEQVIMNLIENGLKYSESTLPIELFVTMDEDRVDFHIIDHGIGIIESRLESIFDGYSNTNNQSSDSTKGFGIGLSICKTIILAHGGTITANNREGGGAIFSFSLPLLGGTQYEQ